MPVTGSIAKAPPAAEGGFEYPEIGIPVETLLRSDSCGMSNDHTNESPSDQKAMDYTAMAY